MLENLNVKLISTVDSLPKDSLNYLPSPRYLIYQKTYGFTIAFYSFGQWRETYNSVIDDEVLYWGLISDVAKDISNNDDRCLKK